MPEKIIHLDSRNSTYIVNPNNTTTNIRNSFNANFKLSERFINIKKISLISLELPIAFNNIRIGSNNIFSFVINNARYNIPINSINYTTIESLILELNTKLNMYLYSPFVIVISIVAATNRMRIQISGTRPITFTMIDTNLSFYILGFRAEYDKLIDTGGETITYTNIVNGVISTTSVTSFPSATSPYYYLASTSTYNLNPDNYISLYIPQLVGCVSDMNGLNSTFKIPMNCIYGMTYFFQKNLNFEQELEIRDKNMILNEMNITVFDRYGKNIDNNGLDYSLSLLIEFEN